MSLQLPLFLPDSQWKAPRIEDLPSWEGFSRVSIDVETRDPYLKELGPGVRRSKAENYVVGYSFALSDGLYINRGYYVPLRHLGGDNVDNPDQAISWLRHQAANFRGEVVGQNLNYDLDWLLELGVEFKQAYRFRDVMLAETLIYELHNSYSLNSILERRGLPLKSQSMLELAAQSYGVDPKNGLWKLPAKFVGEYGEGDAVKPLQVLELQEADIHDQDLWDIWNLESRLLPVLVRMRRQGVRIDLDKLSKIEQWSIDEEQKALDIVNRETGYRVKLGDVWKASALAPALERVGIKLGKTPKSGAPKIDKFLLNDTDHPVAQALARARKVNKLRTTFAESVRRHEVNGRLHATLVQMAGEDASGGVRGGRFGRMSCMNPNLQQQPSLDDFAAMWRSIYIAEEGQEWCCADISQQEPRWAAHFAAKLKLPGAEEMVRRYKEDVSTDSHAMMAEITGLPRKHAKIIGLGIMYGKGGYSLCEELGLPTRMCVRDPRTYEVYDADSEEGQKALLIGGKRFRAAGEEGQRILDRYDKYAPFVRKLSKICQDVVKKRGFIKTILGRHCRFPQDFDGNYDWIHAALNRLIQGSSADQMKKAMIDIDAEGFPLALQVHDEVDLSISSREQGTVIADIIANSVEALVPFKVDVEIGPSWGEAK